MNWYFAVLKKYAVLAGRAQRKEFWYYCLFSFLIAVVLSIIDVVLGIGLLGSLYALAVFIPNITVSVRRLHDIGKSGWWLLIIFLPIIGGIVLLVLWARDSQPGENQYGPNPKAEDAVAAQPGAPTDPSTAGH